MGRIIWINYTVARFPLAKFTFTLQLARDIATKREGSIQLTHAQIDELLSWNTILHRQLSQQIVPPLKIAWSDATPYMIAVIINNKTFTTKSPLPISIAIAESIGAGWAYLLAEQAAHLIVDNTTAGYAFAKGHCKEEQINKIIANTVGANPFGSISWIESKLQLADYPTRGKKLPLNSNTQDISCSHPLKSNFFRNFPENKGGGE